MYWKASATDWMKSSSRMVVMWGGAGPRSWRRMRDGSAGRGAANRGAMHSAQPPFYHPGVGSPRDASGVRCPLHPEEVHPRKGVGMLALEGIPRGEVGCGRRIPKACGESAGDLISHGHPDE